MVWHGMVWAKRTNERTFNRVRLCQLRAVLQQFPGQRVPLPLLLLFFFFFFAMMMVMPVGGRRRRQAQVYVRGGEVVGVELFSMTWPPQISSAVLEVFDARFFLIFFCASISLSLFLARGFCCWSLSLLFAFLIFAREGGTRNGRTL